MIIDMLHFLRVPDKPMLHSYSTKQLIIKECQEKKKTRRGEAKNGKILRISSTYPSRFIPVL